MNAPVRVCLLVLLALVAVAPGLSLAERAAELPAGTRIVTAQELLDAQPMASTLEARWLRLAQRGDFDAIAAELGHGTDPAKELALSGLVRQLPDAPAGRSDRGRAFLQALATRPPRIWMRHEETRGDWFVPALDAGRDAAAALWVMAEDAARQRWAKRLGADPAALAGGFTDAADARHAADALRTLPRDAQDRAAALALRSGEAWPGPVLLALAEARRSAALYRMALARLEPAARVQAVAALPTRLDAPQAQALLRELAADPAVASASVLALAAGYAGDPAVKAWLMDALGDPRLGASAAAALARHGGAGVVAELEQRAARSGKSATPQLWRDLALALRLHGSPAAEQALRRLAADPRMPAALARELEP